MKKVTYLLSIVITMCACKKSEELEPSFYDCELGFENRSDINPLDHEYQLLLNDMTANGVVGTSMSVYTSDNDIWVGTSGKADLFNDIDLQQCHMTRVGSTVKMVTATTVLLLSEEKKLNLDDRIADYLAGDVIDNIENADKATIRQLLQHSSGIYNYIHNLKFQTASLNDLIREWKAEDLLQYAYAKKAYFEPGKDVQYSNTGYILLGLLIEKLENKPLHEVFDNRIFTPLGMHSSSFASKNPVPDGIARGYVDLYSKLQVIESTYFSGWDYYTADGGLISTPYDLNVFFRSLMNGNLVNSESLQDMLSWKVPSNQSSDFFPIAYGLGIFRIETPSGIAYMHSGDAIGYYANMLYFPDDSTTVTYAVNSNYGKIDEFVSTQAAMEKIITAVKN